MNNNAMTRQITMFVMLFIIFFLATGNFLGTIAGCTVNAIIYQWTMGVNKNVPTA